MKSFLAGMGAGLVFLMGWLALSAVGSESKAAPPATLPPAGPVFQSLRSFPLADSVSFAGKALPMDNFDVRERLDLELMRNAYFHRNTFLLLKRAPRFFPVIERILREEGVPEDFKYLAAAESSLGNARSPAGARGVWQFMAPTARAYGLRITGEIDERYHLEKSTRAAARYLNDYYEQFGDWHKVAAAYNMGGPNLKKWLSRQRADEFVDLDINAETMQYLFRIVALKTILGNPTAFGYEVPEEETYAALDDFRTVRVNSNIDNLGDFAREQGTTYRMLKVYNPWLVTGSLHPRRGETIELRLPHPTLARATEPG
jgi:soluble lytic murein transglycosylase-like protein